MNVASFCSRLILLVLGLLAYSECQNLISLEGELVNVQTNPNCPQCGPSCIECGVIQVFQPNLFCIVTPNTMIQSPTGAITFDQLASSVPIPGITPPTNGFIGGTAIVEATQVAPANPICNSIIVDMAENVLIGSCGNTNTGFEVQGVPVVPIQDNVGRYTSSFHNDLGFPIVQSTVPAVDTGCTAEGYMGTGAFYYFSLSLPVGVGSVAPDARFIGVSLARCRVDRLRLLGGLRPPHTASSIVEVLYAPFGIPDPNRLIGRFSVTPDIAPFLSFVIDIRDIVCPTHILVRVAGIPNNQQSQIIVPTTN